MRCRIIQSRHLGVEAVTAIPDSRGGFCPVFSVLPPAEGTTSNVAPIAAADMPLAETMTVMRRRSFLVNQANWMLNS